MCVCEVFDIETTKEPLRFCNERDWSTPRSSASLARCVANRLHIYVMYNGDFFDWPFLEALMWLHERIATKHV